MKRKTWRKNIAILLVIAMMMTIMPMAAFAANEEEASRVDYIFADETEVGATTVQFVYESENGYIPVEGVTATEGAEIDVTVLVNGDLDTDNLAEITCDPEEVVTINEEGKLIAVAAGEATVTAAYAGETATLSVKVVEAVEDVVEEERPSVDVPSINETFAKSKSKTATALDENMQSNITLSLPSQEEQLVSDVVFVLDKSTSTDVQADVLAMLDDLKAQVDSNNAKVNVGVVCFNKEAFTNGLHDLETEYDTIVGEIKAIGGSGSNTHAGLLAAQEMLENDTAVDDTRKYMIFVSDGYTYHYNAEATGIAWSAPSPDNGEMHSEKGSWLEWSASPENWGQKYGHSDNCPNGTKFTTWEALLGDTAAQMDTIVQYEYPVGDSNYMPENLDERTPQDWENFCTYATSIDVALYKTYTTYQEMSEKYHCYAVSAETRAPREWGLSFMAYLAGGKTVDFTQIENDIYYVIASGSVTDYMGYEAGKYDVDFVAPVALTVGGEVVPMTTMSATQWVFGENNQYVLDLYNQGGTDNEYFEWTINVPVSQFKAVSLEYTVVVKNLLKATEEDQTVKASTNGKTVLNYKDSNGNEGEETFDSPEVEYTVPGEKPEPQPTPGGNEGNFDGTTDETIIPDPQTPQAQPPVVNPPVVEEITEPDVPQTDAPVIEVPGEVIEEQPVPQAALPADVAKTGDSSNAFAFAMVLLAAGLGLVVTRRKFN